LNRVPLTFFEVYLVKSDGKKLKMHNAGIYLAPNKVEKILNRPESFEFIWKIQIEWIIEGLKLFDQYLELEDQSPQSLIEIDDWRVNFINWASPTLWYGDVEDITYLDLSALMFLALSISGEDFPNSFEDFSTEVQMRNIVIASGITLFSIIVGYTDSKLLQDLARTFLYFDTIFGDKSWTHQQQLALINLNKQGVDKITHEEVKIIKDSYFIHAKRASKELASYLTFPDVAQYLIWATENLKGDGIELKIKMNEMSDLELIIILVIQGIKYDENLFYKNIKRNLNDLVVDSMNLSDRIRRVISSSIQTASKLNNNFMKISGL